MSELRRYDFYADGDCINDGGCGSRCETPHGQYVDYNEADALLAEKDAEIERLKGHIVALECNGIKHGWGVLSADNWRMRKALEDIVNVCGWVPLEQMREMRSIAAQALATTAQEQSK